MKSNETQPAEPLALTGKQSGVLALLVAGSSIDAAAKAQSVNPSTVFEWLKKDDFKAAYRAAVSEAVNHASGQLKAACSDAVNTLRDVANDSEAPAAPRVSAARAIIELSMKAIELDELAARIEALESLAL